MSADIPIQNLYYLLSYSWEEKLEASTNENINQASCPDLESFFAHILTNRLQPLLNRGLDRSYISYDELSSQPRGRIDFSASAKRQTWLQGRMHCSYDDLSRDVPHNRIIKSTLLQLYRKTQLTKQLKQKIHQQLGYFTEVSDQRVTARSFQRIQLHRNNKSYQWILHICELILNSWLPEHDSKGNRKFRRIEENEKVMPYLFENFILGFTRLHQPQAKSHKPTFKWLADYHSEGAENLMPCMMTDVTIEWATRKLILDCKYYKQAFSKRTYDDEREVERFKTNNLYQVFSYLINKREEPGWEDVEGMLLYPTTTDDFRHDMTLLGRQRLQVCSINLNQDWKKIKEDLLEILCSERATTAT